MKRGEENPYLQFFIGLEDFTQDRPFDASLMVDFRKRFGEEGIQQIAEAIALASIQLAEAAIEPVGKDDDPPSGTPTTSEHSKEKPNRGKLIADATCAPAALYHEPDATRPTSAC